VRLSDEITCTEMVELVTDYLEGGLTADAAERFEEHVVLCPGCTTHVDQMRITIQVAGRLEERDLEPAVAAGMLDAFRGWKARGGDA
jgi:anti-sigma factor RsiW